MKFALALSPKKTKFGPLFFGGDLMTGIKKAAEYGYDGVEISVRHPKELNGKEIRDLVDSLGLEIITLGTGQSYIEDGLRLSSMQKSEISKAIERLCEVIDFADSIGSKGITIGGIRGQLDQRQCDEVIIENTIEGIKEVCSYASSRNITVLLEPVNHYEVSCIHTTKQGIEAVDLIDASNVGLLLDTYHINMEDKSISSSIIAAGDRTKLIHFADNNRLVPGGGFFNFSEMIHALESISYDGYISVEALPLPDSETAAKKAIGYLDSMIMR